MYVYIYIYIHVHVYIIYIYIYIYHLAYWVPSPPGKHTFKNFATRTTS